MAATLRDAALRLSMSALQRNVLPDALLRYGVRQLLEGRLREITLPNFELQMQHLLAFVQCQEPTYESIPLPSLLCLLVLSILLSSSVLSSGFSHGFSGLGLVQGFRGVLSLGKLDVTLRGAFVALKEMPIAVNTEDANAQHYEVPTEFYQLVLGKRLKYSSAYFPEKDSPLDEAEEAMLALYVERAQLKDGQSVLDVGCGWGSLSMYIAEKFPNSTVTGVSNSETQKAFISEECSKRGLSNVTIITCDMNVFNADSTYDRILSIEMFEHMKNYEKLLKNISSWLKPEGLLFIHIFVHKSIPYHFEDQGEDDWMSRNFFTGGTMASSNLLLYFQDDVSIVNQWFVNGTHYARTSEGWLLKMDAQLKLIRPIFVKTYGEADATKWVANWRTFFIAVAEMFAFRNGEEWGVGHYLFKKK